jgi:hypothetical protein
MKGRLTLEGIDAALLVDRPQLWSYPTQACPFQVRREPALTTELELKLVRLNQSRNGKEPQPVGCVDELELTIWGRRVRFERDRSDAAAVSLVRPDVHCAASRVDVIAYLGSRDELHHRSVGASLNALVFPGVGSESVEIPPASPFCGDVEPGSSLLSREVNIERCAAMLLDEPGST